MGGSQGKAIERKFREFERQLNFVKDEAQSTKSSLQASRREVDELKQQLSAAQKAQQLIEMKSQKATMSVEKQLESTEAEVSSTNARLQESKIEVEKLKEVVSSRERNEQEIGMKVGKMMELEKEIYSSMVEVLRNEISLHESKIDEKELREQVELRDKFHQDMEMKLCRVIELKQELCSADDVALSIKVGFDEIREKENGLKEELLAHEKLHQDVELKLKTILHLEEQVSSSNDEALMTKNENLEDLRVKEKVLKEQLSCLEKFHNDMEKKLHEVMKMENQLCLTKNDTFHIKESLESTKKQEVGLKERVVAQERFQQEMEKKLRRVIELEKQLSCAKGEAFCVKNEMVATQQEVKDLRDGVLACEMVENFKLVELIRTL